VICSPWARSPLALRSISAFLARSFFASCKSPRCGQDSFVKIAGFEIDLALLFFILTRAIAAATEVERSLSPLFVSFAEDPRFWLC